MRVLIATGGTGGHIYPALSLAKALKEENSANEFYFIGSKNRMEATEIPQAGYAYQGIDVIGMNGSIFSKLKSLWLLKKAEKECKEIIKKFNPDIVIGFGGYPSASALEAASSLKIKTMIHEQNSIIGLTNKILIKKVDKIICCYQKAYEEFPQEKTLLLGNPRASVVSHEVPKDIYDKYGLDRNKKVVTIVMGSLGSQTVNQTMKESMNQFVGKEYQVLYVTGKPYYESMKDYKNENVKIIPYVDDMPSLMHATDLIVSRAGASTLAELTALGVPAILIPSPYVAANHQEYNARELENNHAAKMILEKDLTGEKLISTIDSVINDQTALQILTENAKKLGKPNAVEDMYQEIISMLGD